MPFLHNLCVLELRRSAETVYESMSQEVFEQLTSRGSAAWEMEDFDLVNFALSRIPQENEQLVNLTHEEVINSMDGLLSTVSHNNIRNDIILHQQSRWGT